MIDLPYIKLHTDAVEPTYGSEVAGCFDFYAIDDIIVPARSCTSTNLQIAVAVPDEYVLEIYSRSGHGFNNQTRLSNCVGLIDADYRGALHVQLRNDSNLTLVIPKGKACAQGKLAPRLPVSFKLSDSLPATARGENGFGSTDS